MRAHKGRKFTTRCQECDIRILGNSVGYSVVLGVGRRINKLNKPGNQKLLVIIIMSHTDTHTHTLSQSHSGSKTSEMAIVNIKKKKKKLN